MKQLDKNARVLRWIAERSPKCWAKQVRQRFQWALALLDQIECKVNQACYLSEKIEYTAQYGCPHCKGFQCEQPKGKCLYPAAMDEFGLNFNDNSDYACSCVAFGGYTLCEVDSTLVRVQLHSTSITVNCLPFSPMSYCDFTEELLVCKRFCQGHINWANDPKWGSKWRRKP